MSNATCNKQINELFTLHVMRDSPKQRPIDRVLERASKLQWSNTELAEKLKVSSQHITNWKTRGLPSAMYEKAARVLNCSVDFIVGTQEKMDPSEAWPFMKVTRQQIIQLDEADRMQLEGVMLKKIKELNGAVVTQHRNWRSSNY